MYVYIHSSHKVPNPVTRKGTHQYLNALHIHDPRLPLPKFHQHRICRRDRRIIDCFQAYRAVFVHQL